MSWVRKSGRFYINGTEVITIGGGSLSNKFISNCKMFHIRHFYDVCGS